MKYKITQIKTNKNKL